MSNKKVLIQADCVDLSEMCLPWARESEHLTPQLVLATLCEEVRKPY